MLCCACGSSDAATEPTPTAEPTTTAESRSADLREQPPVDALLARRQDATLRVCDALENTLLADEPAFFLGALRFAEQEGVRGSELLDAMQRACPGPLRVLRQQPELMAEIDRLR